MAAPGNTIDRRRFLGFLVAGPTLTAAALLLDGAGPPSAATAGVAVPEVPDHYDLVDAFMTAGRPFYYDLLIEITPQNRVRFEVPRAEVGQGVVTAAAMMLADNLDARIEDVDAAPSPAEVRRQTGQFTGTSHSMRSLWDPVRVIAGELRARLATAGAHYLGVPADTVRTEDTHVVAVDGRRVAYGVISEAAARVTVPEVAPVPKPISDLKLVGRPCPRLDATDIVTGRLRYAMDLDVPGALPAVLAFPPTAGATLVSVDDAAGRAMPGVVAVTRIPGVPHAGVLPGVAVVADTVPHAVAGRAALKLQWSAGPMDGVSDDELRTTLRGMLDPAPPPTGEGVDASSNGPICPTPPWSRTLPSPTYGPTGRRSGPAPKPRCTPPSSSPRPSAWPRTASPSTSSPPAGRSGGGCSTTRRYRRRRSRSVPGGRSSSSTRARTTPATAGTGRPASTTSGPPSAPATSCPSSTAWRELGSTSATASANGPPPRRPSAAPTPAASSSSTSLRRSLTGSAPRRSPWPSNTWPCRPGRGGRSTRGRSPR